MTPPRFIYLDLPMHVMDASGVVYAVTSDGVDARVTLTVDEWEQRDRPVTLPVTLDLGAHL